MRRGGSSITQGPSSNGSAFSSQASINGNPTKQPPQRRRRGGGKAAAARLPLPGGKSNHSFVSIQQGPSYGRVILVIVIALVVLDLAYFYKLSSQGLLLHPSSGSHVIARHKHVTTVIFHNQSTPVAGADTGRRHFNLNKHKAGHGNAEAHEIRLVDDEDSNRDRDGPPPARDMLYQQALKRGYNNLEDKEQILNILQQAMLDIDDLDQETIDELPTWKRIQTLYGTEPRILGLETCHVFTETIHPASERFFGVAGVFNSGTNLVAELMIKNCQIQERMEVYGPKSRGIRWQVPWGKHYPASFRTSHLTKTDQNIPYQNSLPLVAIREPYQWMQSMCRHRYEAGWPTSPAHCPNIIASKEELFQYPWLTSLYLDKYNNTRKNQELLVPISIKYNDRRILYKSLPHFWSDWYKLYVKADFPRVIVRFEDLLFYGEEVTMKLCECGGGIPRDDRPHGQFVHISQSAKLGTAAHGKDKTNLLGAILKYGNLDHRLDNMTSSDLAAAKKYFDIHTMNFFNYHHPL